jgi:hypothetical protein
MAETRALRIEIASLVVCMVLQGNATAAPPKSADQSLAPWFNSLSASDGTPCCSIADCRRTVSRTGADGYEVLIDNTWVAVPCLIDNKQSDWSGRRVLRTENQSYSVFREGS